MSSALPKILIVEDDPQVRRFLRTALQGEGYTVLDAGTGKDAMRQATETHPDLILLDLGLPDVDGIELTRQLRHTTVAPIIVVSAREMEQVKVSALDTGADDYLTKPFGVGELLARVRVALRHVGSCNRAGAESAGGFAPGGGGGSGPSASLDSLSPREIEVLHFVAEGKSSKQIANDLFISTKTVVWHRQSIMSKLGIHSVAELTKYAVRAGLTSLL